MEFPSLDIFFNQKLIDNLIFSNKLIFVINKFKKTKILIKKCIIFNFLLLLQKTFILKYKKGMKISSKKSMHTLHNNTIKVTMWDIFIHPKVSLPWWEKNWEKLEKFLRRRFLPRFFFFYLFLNLFMAPRH